MRSCSDACCPEDAQIIHTATVVGHEWKASFLVVILPDLSIIFPLTGIMLKGQNLLNCLCLDELFLFNLLVLILLFVD